MIGNGWEGISDEYSDNMYIYVNSKQRRYRKGPGELEMDYDAGFCWPTLFQPAANRPANLHRQHPLGAGDITELPRKYMTLDDTGVRFFDNVDHWALS